jgi:hypothetical protein
VFNVCSCCIIGPFNTFRLITKPNPGTSSLPFGADTCGVVGVVSLDVVACCEVVAVVWVTGVTLDSVFAGADGNTFASVIVCTFSVVTVADSGAVTGAGMLTGFIGLAGLIGLLMFVGLIALFSQVFCVSTQDPATG